MYEAASVHDQCSLTGVVYYNWCVQQAAAGTPYYTGKNGVVDHREAAEQRIAEARLKSQADQAEHAWTAAESARKQRETLAEEEQKEREARATSDPKERDAQLEEEHTERKAREEYENATRVELENNEVVSLRESAQRLRYRGGSTVSDVAELSHEKTQPEALDNCAGSSEQGRSESGELQGQLADDEQGTSEYWMANQELRTGDDEAASPGTVDTVDCCCHMDMRPLPHVLMTRIWPKTGCEEPCEERSSFMLLASRCSRCSPCVSEQLLFVCKSVFPLICLRACVRLYLSVCCWLSSVCLSNH